MRKSAGFSLIELVVVIAVLGIVFAIAAPRQHAAAVRYRTDLAAKRISADIRLAEIDAWYSSELREVVFDTATESYALTGMLDAMGNPYVVDLSLPPFLVELDAVDFGGSNTLTLDGRGTSGSTGTLSLDIGGATVTATIDATALDDTVGAISGLTLKWD